MFSPKMFQNIPAQFVTNQVFIPHRIGMQRLLSNAVWDEDRVRDEVRNYVLAHLGDPHAIVAIDETSFPKQGDQSAGVAHQYCGTTKQVENCQVDVFLVEPR
jgi:SRSO17 transposase